MKKHIVYVIVAISILRCSDKPEVDPATDNILKVYPNPASLSVNITVLDQQNSSASIKVFDTEGKVILEQPVTRANENYLLSLQDHPPGVYQVILKTKTSITTQKFFKI